MPQPVLHTDRLVLVPLADEHLDLEIDLDSDADVLRYLFPRAQTPDETRAKHARRMARGREVDGLADLGYRIRRDRWRQGFAREGSLELLRHGFETVVLDRVIAQTMAVNTGSRAVMASVGMTFVRSFTEEYDEPVAGHERGEVEYAITSDEWRRASGPRDPVAPRGLGHR